MIKRELIIFLIAGALTVLVDLLSYRCLLYFDIMSVDMAKGASFTIGALFAYVANRFWTFRLNRYRRKSVVRFAVLYASSLGINVLINSIALNFFVYELFASQLAFAFAAGTSAAVNFLGMKFFVFSEGENLK